MLSLFGASLLVLPGVRPARQAPRHLRERPSNLIRRREETAAARSQANTARLLADNPTLLRMKELEALQAILAGTKANFVFTSAPLGDQVRALLAPNGSE